MKKVDAARKGYGLKSLADLRDAGKLNDILTQQKEETVDALSVVARPVEVNRRTERVTEKLERKNEEVEEKDRIKGK